MTRNPLITGKFGLYDNMSGHCKHCGHDACMCVTQPRDRIFVPDVEAEAIDFRKYKHIADGVSLAFARRLASELLETRELNAKLVERMLASDDDSHVGACDCLCKTPDIQFHRKGCRYRLISERNEAIARADKAEARIHELTQGDPCWYDMSEADAFRMWAEDKKLLKSKDVQIVELENKLNIAKDMLRSVRGMTYIAHNELSERIDETFKQLSE